MNRLTWYDREGIYADLPPASAERLRADDRARDARLADAERVMAARDLPPLVDEEPVWSASAETRFLLGAFGGLVAVLVTLQILGWM